MLHRAPNGTLELRIRYKTVVWFGLGLAMLLLAAMSWPSLTRTKTPIAPVVSPWHVGQNVWLNDNATVALDHATLIAVDTARAAQNTERLYDLTLNHQFFMVNGGLDATVLATAPGTVKVQTTLRGLRHVGWVVDSGVRSHE